MKPQNKAIKVLERTSDFLKAGVLDTQPAWFKVVATTPPLTDVTRKIIRSQSDIENQNTDVQQNSIKGGKKFPIYKPKNLTFVEDELRDFFYHQHPWEFARPKIIIETNGNNAAKQDWSRIRQVNTPLEGENVVQRTLWLLQNESNLTMLEAYDKSRFEFYRLRMEDELETQILAEESTMLGAVFGKSQVEQGFDREQAAIEQWREQAAEETRAMMANISGPETQKWAEVEETSEIDEFGDNKPAGSSAVQPKGKTQK